MRGISPKNIPRLVAQDVALVSRHAAIVITITKTGVRAQVNKNPSLNVIAIVGPGTFEGTRFPEALLCEIGIGASRPYTEANIRRSGNRIKKRHKWFTLSPSQYEHMAPKLFQLLYTIAAGRVTQWKSGDRFFLPATRHWHTKRAKRIDVYERNVATPRGCRFSISPDDELLCADVCWAEIHSPRTLRHIQKLGRFIDRTLAQYRKGFSRSFERLGFVMKVASQLHRQLCISIAPHLLIEMLRHYPRGARNPLFPYVEDVIFNLLIEEQLLEIRELVFAKLALPHPRLRVGDIDVQVRNHLQQSNGEDRPRRERTHQDCIVFEMFAHKASEWSALYRKT